MTQKLRTHTAFGEIRVQFPAPYRAAYQCLKLQPQDNLCIWPLWSPVLKHTHPHTDSIKNKPFYVVLFKAGLGKINPIKRMKIKKRRTEVGSIGCALIKEKGMRERQ